MGIPVAPVKLWWEPAALCLLTSCPGHCLTISTSSSTRACEQFYTGQEGVSLVRFTNKKDNKMQRLFLNKTSTRLETCKVRNGKLDFSTGDQGHKEMEKVRQKRTINALWWLLFHNHSFSQRNEGSIRYLKATDDLFELPNAITRQLAASSTPHSLNWTSWSTPWAAAWPGWLVSGHDTSLLC